MDAIIYSGGIKIAAIKNCYYSVPRLMDGCQNGNAVLKRDDNVVAVIPSDHLIIFVDSNDNTRAASIADSANISAPINPGEDGYREHHSKV